MQTIEKYKTRDGKIFNSVEQAESHILSHAQKELKSVLDMAIPSLPDTYGVSRFIILLVIKNREAMQKLKNVIIWLNDLQEEES